MLYVVKIEMDNAAFAEDPSFEVARILRKLAVLEDGHPNFSPGHMQPLHDLNGNEVGWASVEADGREVRVGNFK
jgi:hypothetical protein